MKLSEILIQSQIFSGLDESSIVNLLMHTHYQMKTYEKDEIVLHRNQDLNWCMLVISGSVRGEMNNIDGKILKIEDINPGRVIALAFLFGTNTKIPVSVVANCKTEILRINKVDFLRVMQNNTKILTNTLQLISDRSKFLANKLHFLSMKTIKGKYASFLLEQMDKDSLAINIQYTQEDLSEVFGITRPSLSRAIGELVSEKIITIKGKTITINDMQSLKNYANQ